MARVNSYGVAAIREAVRKRVEASSLRAVAEEVGMSFSGLRSFLNGGKPQARSLKKLQAYVQKMGRDSEASADDIDPSEKEAAKRLLARYVSVPRKSLHESRVREILRDVIGRNE